MVISGSAAAGPVFSARIVQFALKKTGLDQASFATALGVKQPYISRIVHARKSITVAHLLRIAEICGMPLGDLINEECN
jgi:transcriptional regulator with XRE-family HTH domain